GDRLIGEANQVAGHDGAHQDRLVDLEHAPIEGDDCHDVEMSKSYRAGQVLHPAARRDADVPESAWLGITLLEAIVTLEGSAQLDLDDVRVGASYELARGDERRRVAELKRSRRIQLGETLTLVFENRDTIRSTLEEALRTERIDDPVRVASEIATF